MARGRGPRVGQRVARLGTEARKASAQWVVRALRHTGARPGGDGQSGLKKQIPVSPPRCNLGVTRKH